MVHIVPVPLLQDNYSFLVSDGETTVIVDPSEAGPVEAVLKSRGWKLNAILNTHHHFDHVGGNADLKRLSGASIYVPRGDEVRIAGHDRLMEGGTRFAIGALVFDVLFIPGHTRHHIALWMPDAQAVFTGDTLFLMGCGRMFEGTARQMHASLALLATLPGDTRVYCGHEYTLANAEFAISLTPDDANLKARIARDEAKRLAGEPTVPGTMAEELATNPFLRVDQESYREKVCPGADAVTAFAQLRQRKDSF